MKTERLAIPDVVLVTPERRADARGFFVETFNKAAFPAAIGALDWVQDNQSRSFRRGTLRGLHLQAPPHAQDKLVRCSRGAILDVAVDVRRGSATFGRHVAAELTEANGAQLFVPKGFAHGFVTLEDDAEVHYKVTHGYAPESERGVLWRDPALGIDWRVPVAEVVVNARDDGFPTLAAAGDLGF
jgi:dTDP-4-dehydrorhamnose 3,5-epimerase